LSVDLAVFRGVYSLIQSLAYIQAGWVLPGGGRDGLTAIVSAREPQRSTFDRSTLECFGFPRWECSAGEARS